jgi:hypothetical protein
MKTNVCVCVCICEGVGKGSPVWPWYLIASSAVSALSWPVARNAPWHGGANTGSWAVQCCTPGCRLSYCLHLYWGVGSAIQLAPGLSLPLAGCIWIRATQQFNHLWQAVPYVNVQLVGTPTAHHTVMKHFNVLSEQIDTNTSTLNMLCKVTTSAHNWHLTKPVRDVII